MAYQPVQLLTIFCICALISGVAPSALATEPDNDLTAIPLESLIDLKVTSVSKKSQLVNDAAAAVFVITQEDIRRSGVTSIPDALRMVPGLQVARIDSSKWAISARGFNGRFANKLLVLMDGRSLYTPFFLGVYWEVQDTALEDIERIEVIRGPGAALWGSNAVNGVINIITKSANDTTGGFISSGGGSYEKVFATARYSSRLSDSTSLRLYTKHLERGRFSDSSGNAANDAWEMTRGGFRLDSHPSSRDTITLQGDYYRGGINETYRIYNLNPTPPNVSDIPSNSSVSGGNLLTRWQRSLAGSDSLSLQIYYDHSERDMHVAPQKFNMVDMDLHHRAGFGRHDLIWGAGYRYSQYRTTNTPILTFDRTDVVNNLFSAFIHDEITLMPDTLLLVLGSRFEQSSVAGFDVQPTGRLIWKPDPLHTFWTAVSRAVRAKTRGEEDIHYFYRTVVPAGQPIPVTIHGNRQFKSEEVLSCEAGYRTEFANRASIDIATYYNDYRNLRVLSVPTPSVTGIDSYLVNAMRGHSYGAELAFDWTPLEWLRLQAAYSYERFAMVLDRTSTDAINKGNAEGDTPRHQFSIRSGFNLTRRLSLDLWLRGTNTIDSIDGISIPGYTTLDARLAWNPHRSLELSLVGQNLLDNRHQEFIPEYINTLPSEVVRSVYGKVTWKF